MGEGRRKRRKQENFSIPNPLPISGIEIRAIKTAGVFKWGEPPAQPQGCWEEEKGRNQFMEE